MDAWRLRIEACLKRASARRTRALFAESNPHLVGDRLFEARWASPCVDAAVLIPIIGRAEPTVLLTLRSPDMPSHAAEISLPGGRLHGDEGAVAAALREAFEEANIAPEFITVLGALGVHKGGIGYSVTPVVGLVDPKADIRPCPREVAEIFEVPLAHIADLKNHYMEEKILEGVAYNMFAADWGRFHIWGLTAGILRTLAEALDDAGGDAAAE